MEAIEFYGKGQSVEHYDALMHTMKSTWVAEERSLFGSKWFDYRQLHPTEATYLYAHHFAIIYRRRFAQVVSRRAAEHIKVYKNEDVFKGDKGNASGLWRGRMVADMMGMPYDLYIEFAMKWRLQFWQQRQMPRSQQLYSPQSIEPIHAMWEDYKGTKVMTGSLPVYQNEHYCGLAMQNDHHEWLFELVGRASDLAWIVSEFLKKSILPIDKVRARLGDEIAEKALAIA